MKRNEMAEKADENVYQLMVTGRKEWTTAVLISLLLSVLLLVPYWLGYTSAAPDQFFTGILMNPEDSQTYFAKMLAGYDGAWLYAIPFTPEQPQPAFLGGFYILLGRLARLANLSLEATWHIARFFSGFIMGLSIFYFLRAFVNERLTLWLAYLLALGGSGLGWLLFLLQQPYWLDAFPVDFKMAEARPFFTALVFPHIALATGLMLFSFPLLLRALHAGPPDAPAQRGNWGNALGAGLLMLGVGILHPLLIYLLALIWALYWLYLTLTARRIAWRAAWLIALAFALPALLYAYYAYGLLTDPVLRAWDAQRESTLSPPWPHYLLAFGPYLLLAAWTVRLRKSTQGLRPERQVAFLWLWILAAALLIYAPLSSQRRFIQGVHVPLSLLTAVAFTHLFLPWLEQRRWWRALLQRPRYEAGKMRTLATAVFLLFMSLSNAYVLASVSVSAIIQQPDPLFRPIAERDAATWLRANGQPGAVLLGSYQTGNYVAAHTGLRVVLGHWAETGNFAQKEQEVVQFFAANTPDANRQSILQAYGVKFVWHGPRERELGDFDPATASYLRPVHQSNSITLYETWP